VLWSTEASWGNGDSMALETGHGATPKSFVHPINTFVSEIIFSCGQTSSGGSGETGQGRNRRRVGRAFRIRADRPQRAVHRIPLSQSREVAPHRMLDRRNGVSPWTRGTVVIQLDPESSTHPCSFGPHQNAGKLVAQPPLHPQTRVLQNAGTNCMQPFSLSIEWNSKHLTKVMEGARGSTKISIHPSGWNPALNSEGGVRSSPSDFRS